MKHEAADPLLTVVDKLTKPTFKHLWVDTPEGKRVRTVEHPALLRQLEDAVTASMGNDGRSKSTSAMERNMLDSEALFEFLRIKSQIGDWCRLRDVQPTRDPVQDLRAWHVAHIGQSRPQDDFYVEQLRGWVGIIRARLDPPKRFEITQPCPVCGVAEVMDADGLVSKAVVVEYRDYGTSTPIRPRAVCRNALCQAVWDGLEAIEELGDELREKASGQ